jgi:RsbT co-antagonist protein rsbRD N-terminal domain
MPKSCAWAALESARKKREGLPLLSLIKQNKTDIAKAWIDATLGAFPADGAKFFSTSKDPFGNPVGTAVTSGIHELLDALLENAESEEIAKRLDRIVQVYCVQEMLPSKTVLFVFLLKKVLREKFEKELQEARVLAGYLDFEIRIDHMAGLAFDVYVNYRMRIAEIRVNEIKSQVATLYRRSTIFSENSESGSNHDKEASHAEAESNEVGSG